MAKITITGIREYNFNEKEDGSGRNIVGMSVYYAEQLETKNGIVAKGFTTGKLSVQKGSPLYDRMLNANYAKPFEAECVFDIVPGNKRPVLADIKF